MDMRSVEVRDSRTGYFIPARYGLGLLQMGELSARRRRRRRRRRHLGIQVDIQARKLCLVFIWFCIVVRVT